MAQIYQTQNNLTNSFVAIPISKFTYKLRLKVIELWATCTDYN